MAINRKTVREPEPNAERLDALLSVGSAPGEEKATSSLTFIIPTDLKQEFKFLAARSGRKMQSCGVEAIREWVAAHRDVRR